MFNDLLAQLKKLGTNVCLFELLSRFIAFVSALDRLIALDFNAVLFSFFAFANFFSSLLDKKFDEFQ